MSPTSRSLMALSPTSRQIVASSLVSLKKMKKQNNSSDSSSAIAEETEQEKEESHRTRIARLRIQIPGESSSTTINNAASSKSSCGGNNMQEEVTKLMNMDVTELTKLVEALESKTPMAASSEGIDGGYEEKHAVEENKPSLLPLSHQGTSETIGSTKSEDPPHQAQAFFTSTPRHHEHETPMQFSDRLSVWLNAKLEDIAVIDGSESWLDCRDDNEGKKNDKTNGGIRCEADVNIGGESIENESKDAESHSGVDTLDESHDVGDTLEVSNQVNKTEDDDKKDELVVENSDVGTERKTAIITSLSNASSQTEGLALEEKAGDINVLTKELKASKAERDRLKKKVDALITSNKEKVEQITLLEDTLVGKEGMFEEMITYINKCNATCVEMEAEKAAQDEKIELSQVECSQLKEIIRDLEARLAFEKEEKDGIIRKSEECLKSVTEQLANVSAQNESLEEEVRNLSSSLVEMSFDSHEKKSDPTAYADLLLAKVEINELMTKVESLAARNEELESEVEALKDELNIEVESLAASNNELVTEVENLLDDADASSKKSNTSLNTNEWRSTCERMTAEIEALVEQLDLTMAENDELETRNDELEARNENLETELQALIASNKGQEMDKKIAQNATLSNDLKATIDVLVKAKGIEKLNSPTSLEGYMLMAERLQEMNEENENLHIEVKQAYITLEDLYKVNKANVDKNVELSGVIERMTQSMNYEKQSVQRVVELQDELTSKNLSMDEMAKEIDSQRKLLEDKTESLERKTTKIGKLAEGLQIAMNQIEWLESQVHEMTMDVFNKKLSIEENNAQIADLTNRLQLSTAKNDAFEAEVKSFVVCNKENSQQISESLSRKVCRITTLEEELAAAMSLNDEISAEITKWSASCSSMATEIDSLIKQLERSKTENVGLKAEIESSVASNKETFQQMSALEENLAAKNIVIEGMTVEIQLKCKQLEEKTTDIIHLAERLDKHDDVTNRNTRRIKSLENELSVARASHNEMSTDIFNKNISLQEKIAEVADLTEKLHLVQVKNEELDSENRILVDSNKDIVHITERLQFYMKQYEDQRREVTNMVADKKEQMHQLKVASDKEIAYLNERLARIMANNEELDSKVQVAATSIKESIEQMAMLEDDNEAKQIMIDKMSAEIVNLTLSLEKLDDINTKNVVQITALEDELTVTKAAIEDKNHIIEDMSVDIVTLTEQYDKLKYDNSENASKISALEEELVVTKIAIDAIAVDHNSKTVDVANLTEQLNELRDLNSENITRISVLEEEMTMKNAAIDELTVDINTKILSLEEKSAEIAHLAEQLRLTIIQNEELDAENRILVDSNKEVVYLAERLQLYKTNNEAHRLEIKSLIADKKEQIHQLTVSSNADIADLNARLELVMARNKELEIWVDRIKQMSALEEDNEAKKKIINDLSADIVKLRTACEALAAENSSLTEQQVG